MKNPNDILYLIDENTLFEKIDAPIDDILNKYSYSVSVCHETSCDVLPHI